MAWCRLGDKPLSEPMMVRSLTHICVTRPQWVNIFLVDHMCSPPVNLSGNYSVNRIMIYHPAMKQGSIAIVSLAWGICSTDWVIRYDRNQWHVLASGNLIQLVMATRSDPKRLLYFSTASLQQNVIHMIQGWVLPQPTLISLRLWYEQSITYIDFGGM